MSRPAEHPPGYKENEYSVLVECSNCGNTYALYIEKGTLVSSVLKDKVCNRCGCEGTLEKII